MDVAHEDDGAFEALVVKRRDLVQFFDLIFVTHRHDTAIGAHEWADQIDDGCETGDDVGGFDKFASALSEIAEIAGTGANTGDHKVAGSKRGARTASLLGK
jgi:hypothetical protein